jgi:hypothetical protein
MLIFLVFKSRANLNFLISIGWLAKNYLKGDDRVKFFIVKMVM